jgi:hypothetical protein
MPNSNGTHARHGPSFGRHAQLFLLSYFGNTRPHLTTDETTAVSLTATGEKQGFPKAGRASSTASTERADGSPNSGRAGKAGKPRATRGGLAGAARRCFSCSLAVLPASGPTTLNELLAGGTYYKHQAGCFN